MSMVEKKKLLVTRSGARKDLEGLAKHADVYWLDELSQSDLDALLPSIDCILVAGFWPKALDQGTLSRMGKLRFIQSTLAGVNHIPFQNLPKEVAVSSNAGGFSQGVAEHAWGLLLASAKRIVRLDEALKAGKFAPDSWSSVGREVVVLEGKSLGVVGYGGIGRSVAAMGRAFGMKVYGFSRHPESEPGTEVFQGREGLLQMLRITDAAVISIPLTNRTVGLIGAPELSAMKSNAILVNIARAEIVDEEELYRHLVKNPSFTYATDVWRLVNGMESFSSGVPLLELDNFIGTPHVSGWSTSLTGEPMKHAVENLLRYTNGATPDNVVDHSEYT